MGQLWGKGQSLLVTSKAVGHWLNPSHWNCFSSLRYKVVVNLQKMESAISDGSKISPSCAAWATQGLNKHSMGQFAVVPCCGLHRQLHLCNTLLSTGWVRSQHCSQTKWKREKFSERKILTELGFKPGLLGGKQECFLCAMQPGT